MDFTDPFKMNERQLKDAKISLEFLLSKAEGKNKKYFENVLKRVNIALREFK